MPILKNARQVDIYGLYDPLTDALRYVGKANDANTRLLSHINDSRRSSTPVYVWIRNLIEAGLLPVCRVICKASEEAWQEVEKREIALAKLVGHDLLNVHPGGNQPACTGAPSMAPAKAARAGLNRLIPLCRLMKQNRSEEDIKVWLSVSRSFGEIIRHCEAA